MSLVTLCVRVLVSGIQYNQQSTVSSQKGKMRLTIETYVPRKHRPAYRIPLLTHDFSIRTSVRSLFARTPRIYVTTPFQQMSLSHDALPSTVFTDGSPTDLDARFPQSERSFH